MLPEDQKEICKKIYTFFIMEKINLTYNDNIVLRTCAKPVNACVLQYTIRARKHIVPNRVHSARTWVHSARKQPRRAPGKGNPDEVIGTQFSSAGPHRSQNYLFVFRVAGKKFKVEPLFTGLPIHQATKKEMY